MILVIDNYDSFVYNLARYIERLGGEVRVVRNDTATVTEIERMQPQALVISPGPCTPDVAGVSIDLVRRLHASVPMLGVCLGHQAIAQALGGAVVRAETPWHGRAAEVTHDGIGLFASVPSPLTVGRYHSLVVDPNTLPPELESTAWTADGVTMMAFAHRNYPVFGVQFHPESILSEHGYSLLRNFLDTAGIATTGDPVTLAASERAAPNPATIIPTGPITF